MGLTIVFLILSLTGLIMASSIAVAGISRLVHYVLQGSLPVGWINVRFWSLVCCVVCIGAIGLAFFSQAIAATPAIEDASGNELEGSIAELMALNLNGREEWVSIRGLDRNAPVLLFLAGGPGGTQMAAVRHDLAELEKHFVVVNWDQPGSGKSFGAVPSSEISIDMYVDDGCALAQYLSNRFHWDSIYLVGESWGSALGIMMVDKDPELFKGFIGTGQMVDFLATEIEDYQLAMEMAEASDNTKKVQSLKANGMPPYEGKNTAWKSAEYLGYLGDMMAQNPEIDNAGYSTGRDLLSSEYGIIDKINYFRGLLTTFNTVYPQLYGTDLRSDYPNVEVPIAFFLGRHDINAPAHLAETYYESLQAPEKRLVWFEHSGHSPWINESELFVDELLSFAGMERE